MLGEQLQEQIRKILIIYAGGTIGMKMTPLGYSPIPGYLTELLPQLPQFQDKNQSACITPISQYGWRAVYKIIEYEPLLDSADMGPEDWIKIATDIEKHYESFDSFIILQGTDTLAYTASALSFMFDNLTKPVLLTGSQIPLSQIRNDATENLLGAMNIATHFKIPEVLVYFRNKCFRGNRSKKVDAVSFDAFDSPNYTELAHDDLTVKINWHLVCITLHTHNHQFKVHKKLNKNVASLRLFPGVSCQILENLLKPPTQGLILETFGTGNGPAHRPEFLKTIKDATDRGVVIVNITQ
jgi:lysophospholipase